MKKRDFYVNAAQKLKRERKVESARAEALLAKERIKLAKADLAKVEALLGFAVIKAPFDGVITRRWTS